MLEKRDDTGALKLYNWDDARKKCKELDSLADLATIRSEEENDFIKGKQFDFITTFCK